MMWWKPELNLVMLSWKTITTKISSERSCLDIQYNGTLEVFCIKALKKCSNKPQATYKFFKTFRTHLKVLLVAMINLINASRFLQVLSQDLTQLLQVKLHQWLIKSRHLTAKIALTSERVMTLTHGFQFAPNLSLIITRALESLKTSLFMRLKLKIKRTTTARLLVFSILQMENVIQVPRPANGVGLARKPRSLLFAWRILYSPSSLTKSRESWVWKRIRRLLLSISVLFATMCTILSKMAVVRPLKIFQIPGNVQFVVHPSLYTSLLQ